MLHVSDLPPELLLKVFSQLGSGSSYSDRERQRDLAGVAKVCRRFSELSIPLLYGDTIQVRSAGRQHCLARTLEADPALAASVHDLVVVPTADQAHAPSALVLLRSTPNLASLTLGEALFNQLEASHMRDALAAKALKRFSFGFSAGESETTSLVDLAPLLVGWTVLEHLELHGVPPDHRVRGVATAAQGPPAALVAVGPLYRLAHLEVHGVEGWHSRSFWSTAALDWVLGRSHALTSLALVDMTCGFALPALFDELVSRGCGSTLSHLALRRIRVAAHISPRLLDPNDLGTWFPSLTHLSFQDEPRTPICAAPSPAFRPSSSLRVLELHGRWPKHDLNLVRMLEGNVETSDGGQAALGKLKVVGLSPTNADVKELSAACRRHAIVFELVCKF
ncbi:hypothetical protein JCM3775_001083 [Rhodotorula graminis]|uniref:F-box domain-containing protein n=1 Tax=Rhodotorula graminis (strain WP1) TaxID=578459 RepID=A0A194S5V6_RHOGW|nr:uncharacterized protein RHOBADRAFT_53744 [Rhodotorula graminis WP1]KPV74806.1 hypothetical protein RHOBADRAFT_53744 [Rhodotorula graminis WP1]